MARMTCMTSRHSGTQFNFVFCLIYVARVRCKRGIVCPRLCEMQLLCTPFCTSHWHSNMHSGLHANLDSLLLSASGRRLVHSEHEAIHKHAWNVIEHWSHKNLCITLSAFINYQVLGGQAVDEVNFDPLVLAQISSFSPSTELYTTSVWFFYVNWTFHMIQRM